MSTASRYHAECITFSKQADERAGGSALQSGLFMLSGPKDEVSAAVGAVSYKHPEH
jgi:hypothetical protein